MQWRVYPFDTPLSGQSFVESHSKFSNRITDGSDPKHVRLLWRLSLLISKGGHNSMRMLLQSAGLLSGRHQVREPVRLCTTKANIGLVASTSGRSPDGMTRRHVRARRTLRCVASSVFAEVSAEEEAVEDIPAPEAQQDDDADSKDRESRSEEATAELLNREVSRRRNFAIISHPDAGKTTLVCIRRQAQKGGALMWQPSCMPHARMHKITASHAMTTPLPMVGVWFIELVPAQPTYRACCVAP